MILRSFFIMFILGYQSSLLAVDFNLPDLDGAHHRMADYQGKWVVVNFWASWCGPCVEELAELDFFYNEHRNNTVVLGFNVETDKSAHDLKQFTELYAVNYPILRSTRSLPGYGEVVVVPTTLIISPQGEIVGKKIGKITGAYIENVIAKDPAPIERKDIMISEIGS